MRERSSGEGQGGAQALFQAVEGLQRLTELVERRRQQLARAVGLSPQQWRVLEEIGRDRDRFMPSLFARSRNEHAAGVSRTLRQLLERELVESSISPSDARKRSYRLTRRGRRVLADLRAARQRALDTVWQDLAPRDLERFARFAGRLADRLEAYTEAAEIGL